MPTRPARDLRRERAAQGAPCRARDRAAGVRRRFRPVRRCARRRARPVSARATPACTAMRRAQHRKLLDATARACRDSERHARTSTACIVLLRHADDPQPLIAEGSWHGRDPRRAARRRRLRLRPGVLRSRSSDRAAAELDAGDEEPRQPPRPGAGARCAQRTVRSHERCCRDASPTLRCRCRRSSLYVHLPWCVRKCPYCDFNSHEAPRRAAVRRVRRRADRRPRSGPAAGVGPHGAQRVLRRRHAQPVPAGRDRRDSCSGASAGCASRPDAEITLETNPGTAEHGRFEGYRAAGVNRLSFGIQSFDDGCLQRLGRIHDSARGRARGEAGAGRRLRQLQPRPDVRAAGADAGDGRARRRARDRAAAARTFRITS